MFTNFIVKLFEISRNSNQPTCIDDERNIVKRDTEIAGAAIYVDLLSLDRLESLNVGSTT